MVARRVVLKARGKTQDENEAKQCSSGYIYRCDCENVLYGCYTASLERQEKIRSEREDLRFEFQSSYDHKVIYFFIPVFGRVKFDRC